MCLKIVEVIDAKALKAFIHFPLALYKNNPYFIPAFQKEEQATLSKDKNPAFDSCEARYWLAYKKGKVVGRIAAIINHSFIERWENKYMRFGWLDFENDQEVLNALLLKVELWAKEKRLTAVHGPLGFTNFDHGGMLVDGYDQIGTMATLYNYPYYAQLIENAGYVKDVDWVEYKIAIPEVIPERVNRIASIVEKRLQLSVVKAKKTSELLPYGKEVFRLINSVYSDLYGVVPLSEKQIDLYIKKYLKFLQPDFVSFIINKDKELVALGIAMPSLTKALQKTKGKLFPLGFFYFLNAMKHNDIAEMLLVAIRKDLQGKGVNSILMRELTASLIRNKFKFAESNPELEDNAKVQSIWSSFDAVQHKRRRCYIKKLKQAT